MNIQWPQWTSELVSRHVTGEDQLGIEGAAQSYQQSLVPGIITVTDRARYYSYYAWVLYRFINDPNSSRLLRDFQGDYFKHHEMALIVSSFSHHRDGEVLNGLVGAGNNNYKARSYWEQADPIPLDQDYFQNKLGGFGQYYSTSMQVMEIVSENDQNPNWVYKLTDRGVELAKAYEDTINQTTYFGELSQKGDLKFLSRSAAEEYGKLGCICPKALALSKDREILRDTFFRFDKHGQGSNHYRRRLTLGVALDLVYSANNAFRREMLRPALYLGEFSAGNRYIPSEPLSEWVQRWKMVEIRHLFTFGLQNLWGAFLLELGNNGPLTLADFLDWAKVQLSTGLVELSASDALSALCDEFHLGDWQSSYKEFSQTCLQATQKDEFSIYKSSIQNSRDAGQLLKNGFLILNQFFLRFLPLAEENSNIWKEMADLERLPFSRYFQAMKSHLECNNFKVSDWMEWIYREYILGQHEFIALEKLRYQEYNTFKFYYQKGTFFWPYSTPNFYQEPIRLAANRLNNCITMLVDLGLIDANPDGMMNLTSDGASYYQRILRELRNGN